MYYVVTSCIPGIPDKRYNLAVFSLYTEEYLLFLNLNLIIIALSLWERPGRQSLPEPYTLHGLLYVNKAFNSLSIIQNLITSQE